MKVDNYKIYKYTSPSNKVYIGQTKQTLKERANGQFGHGYRHSAHFYAAIKKYGGLQNFTVEILKDHLTLEEANEWEQIYIKMYDSTNPKKGYNIAAGGDNHIMSTESKQKHSIRMTNNNPMHNPDVAKKVATKRKGVPLSEQAKINISNGHKKRVLCIETGVIYNSRNEAAAAVGVSGSGIVRAINGEQKTSGGYHWRYYED